MMGRRRSKRRALKWVLYILSGVSVVLVLLWVIPIDDIVMATGVVEPGGKVFIDSPLRGIVKKIYTYEGSLVKEGQIVAQLDDKGLKSEVVTAKDEFNHVSANLDLAKAKLDQLKEQPFPEDVRMAEVRLRATQINLEAERHKLARADSLWVRNFITLSDMETARTSYELARSDYDIAVENLKSTQHGPSSAQIRGAQAEVKAAEAFLVKAQHNLEVAQEILASGTLRSSEYGVVVRVDLLPGMLADQGDVVMVIASGDESFLKAWVKEINIWKVKQGQPVEILSNVFSDREAFLSTGEVVQVYPYGVSGGGERAFEIMIKIKDAVIPPPLGSTADARVIVGRRGILKVWLGIENDVRKYIKQDGSRLPKEIENSFKLDRE